MLRGVLIEGQYVGRGFDPVAECRFAAGLGADVLFPLIYESYRGKTLFPWQRHPDLNAAPGRDLVREYVAACQTAGLRTWAWSIERGAPVDSPLCATFADGIITAASGEPLPPWHDRTMRAFCPNSPWRDFVTEMYHDFALAYPEIGLLVVADQPGQFAGGCYCRYCRDRFRREVGADLPTVPDWQEGSLWLRFLRQRSQWWLDFLQHVSAACKSARSDIETAVNLNPGSMYGSNPLEYGIDMWDLISPAALDWLVADCWRGNQHPAWHRFAVSLAQSLAAVHGKRAFSIIGAQVTNGHEMASALFEAAAAGADVLTASPLHAMMDYPEVAAAVRQVFSGPLGALQGSKPRAEAIVALSRQDWETSLTVDARSHLRAVYGAWLALTLAGVTARVATLDEVAALRPGDAGRLLVLAGTEGGGDARRAAEGWRAAGGAVLVVGGAGWDGFAGFAVGEPVAGHAITYGQDAARLVYWSQRGPECHRRVGHPRGETLATYGVAGGAAAAVLDAGGHVALMVEPLAEGVIEWMERGRGAKHHSMWYAEARRHGDFLGMVARRLLATVAPDLRLPTGDGALDAYAAHLDGAGGPLYVCANHDHGAPARLRLPVDGGWRLDPWSAAAVQSLAADEGTLDLVLAPGGQALVAAGESRPDPVA